MNLNESRWLIHHWFTNIDKDFSYLFYEYEATGTYETGTLIDPERYNGEYLVQPRIRTGAHFRDAEVDVHTD